MHINIMQDNIPYKIIAVTVGSFPFGGAWTNRELSYLRGLTEVGIDVKLIILAPDYNQSLRSCNKKSVFNNIRISYSCLCLYPNNEIIFFINYLWGIVKGIYNLMTI